MLYKRHKANSGKRAKSIDCISGCCFFRLFSGFSVSYHTSQYLQKYKKKEIRVNIGTRRVLVAFCCQLLIFFSLCIYSIFATLISVFYCSSENWDFRHLSVLKTCIEYSVRHSYVYSVDWSSYRTM